MLHCFHMNILMWCTYPNVFIIYILSISTFFALRNPYYNNIITGEDSSMVKWQLYKGNYGSPAKACGKLNTIKLLIFRFTTVHENPLTF